MSGPPSGTSSRAPEGGEEAFVVGDDTLDRRGLRGRVPLVELERASEDDPVGPREHVAGPAGERILDLGLRLEDRELAARGAQVLVAEQLAAAEPRAVEYQRFGQSGNVGGCREAADLDPSAGDLHVLDHLPQVAARLDVHRVVAKRSAPRERMLGAA